MTSSGTTVLCIHDSFIVKSIDEDILKRTMQEAYKHVLRSVIKDVEGLEVRFKSSGVTLEEYLDALIRFLDPSQPPLTQDEILRFVYPDPEAGEEN